MNTSLIELTTEQVSLELKLHVPITKLILKGPVGDGTRLIPSWVTSPFLWLTVQPQAPLVRGET